jgi:two-component system sensor histidine kinase YesM
MNSLRRIFLKKDDYVSFYLVNDKDDIVYAPKENMFYKNESYADGIISDRNNIVCESGYQNISYLENWKLIGVYDKSRIRNRQLLNVALVLIVNILLGMLMTGAVYLVYHSYSSRISKLTLSMNEVEHEVFKPVEGNYGDDEIGSLTQTYNHMIEKINELINNVYKLETLNKSAELEKTRAELRALQSQVDPHFIFNVLNAIMIFSVKNGYDEIVPQISGLSKMIRRLLDWSYDSEPLSNEMSFIETYLQLEKFRFGDKFNYDICVSPEAAERSIPKMIIQPLIENSCRHGLQGVIGDRYVRVRADMNDNVLTVSAADNGNGIPADKLREIRENLACEDFSGHIGVKNVYRRLKLYFGDNADMRINSEEGKGTEVVITIDYGAK